MPTDARILVADDDPVFRAVLVGTLAQAGFDVIEAEDGAAAVRRFTDDEPDLILLDVMMPELDGFEVCEAVRDAPSGAQVPILIMTALDDLASIERAYQAGATDFLEKPPNWGALPRRLQYVLRASRAMSELHASREAAESANRAKSGFLANVSHEIRTPTAAILGYLECLRDDPALAAAGEDVHEAVAAIERNGRFLIQLIDDILESAQIESGRLSIVHERVEPHALARALIAGFTAAAQEKGLDLVLEIADSVPEAIESDPTRLRQVLQNLVGNAIKFTESGHVRVSLFVERSPQGAGTLGIAVSDTGIGIPPEDRQRILEPFAQVDSSRSKRVGGIGLGLSIVERVVHGMNGSLALDSTEGVGSCFTVRLPLRGEPGSEHRPSTPAPSRFQGRCAILLAEDSRDNQILLARILEQAGAEVVVVNDGQRAVETLLRDRDRFDLVLMDMQMPTLDGYAATTLARESDVTVPIIALTAHAAAGERERCLAAGCNDYATKPIARGELIAIVSDWLAKRSAS